MITTRPADVSDVLRVIANASEATLFDIDVLGHRPEATIRYFVRKAQRGADAFVQDGKTIAVFGWDKTPGAWFSWLLSTPQFLTPDTAPVFAGRKLLRKTRRENPGVTLFSLVTSADDNVSRWMRCMGFERVVPARQNLWRYAG